jgi:hypothetical protein
MPNSGNGTAILLTTLDRDARARAVTARVVACAGIAVVAGRGFERVRIASKNLIAKVLRAHIAVVAVFRHVHRLAVLRWASR